MSKFIRALTVWFGLLPSFSAAAEPGVAQPQSIPQTTLESAAHASFSEFFEMLALPNDAVNPADIQHNADWLETAFRKRGFVTRQLPNNGKPHTDQT